MADDESGNDDTQEVSGRRTSRRELLRRASTGAVVFAYGGAAAKTAVAKAPQYRHKQLAGTLRIGRASCRERVSTIV